MQSQGRDRRCDAQHSGNGSRYSLPDAPPNPADPTGISRPSVRVLRALEGPLWVLDRSRLRKVGLRFLRGWRRRVGH